MIERSALSVQVGCVHLSVVSRGGFCSGCTHVVQQL